MPFASFLPRGYILGVNGDDTPTLVMGWATINKKHGVWMKTFIGRQNQHSKKGQKARESLNFSEIGGDEPTGQISRGLEGHPWTGPT